MKSKYQLNHAFNDEKERADGVRPTSVAYVPADQENGVTPHCDVRTDIEAGALPEKPPAYRVDDPSPEVTEKVDPAVKKESAEDDDPWTNVQWESDHVPWSELTLRQKIWRAVSIPLRIILVLGLLYMFVCSLDFLGSAFQLLGGRGAAQALGNSELMNNPIAGLMIGVIATVLLQSSSTTTSIVVTMVASRILTVQQAVYIIMGSNVGTSVTNVIVSSGQAGNRDQFRRAFGGATVHDCFNWLSVLVLLPIEYITQSAININGNGGILAAMTAEIVKHVNPVEGDTPQFLKVITKPFTDLFVKLDRNVYNSLTLNDHIKFEDYNKRRRPLLKYFSDKKDYEKCGYADFKTDRAEDIANSTLCGQLQTPYIRDHLRASWTGAEATRNTTWIWDIRCGNCSEFVNPLRYDGVNRITSEGQFNSSHPYEARNPAIYRDLVSKPESEIAGLVCTTWQNLDEAKPTFWGAEGCKLDSYAFHGQGLVGSSLPEWAVGLLLLLIALAILITCLIFMVKVLSSLLKGPIAVGLRKVINSDLPKPFGWLTGYLVMIVGAGFTVLVQSSSVFTSTLTPLVGMGVVTLERVYPLTLGANIGTTITGMLAALTNFTQDSLRIAFCHLFFNLFGIALWYPIPLLRRIPIKRARFLGNTTADYKWFAPAYIIFMFLIFPLTIFGLSMAGWYVLLGVAIPIIVVILFVVVVSCMQSRCKNRIHPKCLRSWGWLPEPLRSLDPYDRVIRRARLCCNRNCKCCSSDKKSKKSDDNSKDIATEIVEKTVPVIKQGTDNPVFTTV